MTLLNDLSSTDCICSCDCGCLFFGAMLTEEGITFEMEPNTCPDCWSDEFEVFELSGEDDEWEEAT